MKGAQSPALRRRICIVTVRATKLGRKKGQDWGRGGRYDGFAPSTNEGRRGENRAQGFFQ